MQVLTLIAFFALVFSLSTTKTRPIFEMPNDSLSLEERLSPIKLTTIKQPIVKDSMDQKDQSDGEFSDKSPRPTFSGLIKHPHGLQAKHDYRRNTLTHPSSFKTPSKHSVRDVVTSPRLVAPVLRPDHTDSIADSPSYRIRSKRASLIERFDDSSYDVGKGLQASHSGLSDHTSPNRKRSSGDFTVSVSKLKRISHTKSSSANGEIEQLTNNIKSLEEMNSSPEKPKSQVAHLTSTLATSLPTKAINGNNEPSYSESKKDTSEFEVSREGRLVYTAIQMDITRQNLYNEITKLELSIKNKNDEIIQLSNAFNDAGNKILRLEENFDENLRVKNHLEESLRLSGLQIENLDRDLTSIDQKLKENVSLLKRSEDELVTIQRRHKDEIDQLNANVSGLEEHLKQLESKLAEYSLISTDLKSENESLKLQARNLSEEKMELQKDIDSFTNSRDLLLAKVEELSKDKEILTTRLESRQDTLSEKNDQLSELNQKFKDLCEETTSLHNEMAKFETEQKLKDKELSEKDNSIDELTSLCSQLEDELSSLKAEYESNRELLQDDVNLKSNLQSENERLLETIVKLKNQNLEKDQIISGDTKKLTELVEEVNKQKQFISDFKMNANKSEASSENELLKQIASLKHQVATAQQKTDERIQDVAEQLYHQYSKKHELKVNQLKEKYDAKIEESLSELELKRREIETLDSQLKTEMKEKNYLLSALEKSDISLKRTPSRKRI